MNINATLLGQMITFLIFVGVTMKYIWPPVTKAMEDRRQNIATRLQQAEDAQREASETREKIASSLKNTEAKAQHIIQSAQSEASQWLHEAQQRALLLEKQMLNQSEQTLKKQQQHAKQQLKTELSSLILAAAEKVVKEHLNPQTHQALIDRFIDEAL